MEDERYCFIVEWLDPHSGLTMRYQMLYGPADCSVEMYDIKNRRPFLKKTRIPTVTVDTLHMGAVVTVYSRQLKIVEYGDAHTENAFSLARQATLCVVKPGAVHLAGKVINAAQKSGFAVARVKMASLSRDDAADLIGSSGSSSSDPSGAIAELATGPSVGVALVGDGAVESFKRLVQTELVPALGDCVWCADSAERVDAMTRAYFAKPPACRLSDTALAVVKPSAMANLGLVMDAVCGPNAGFAMTGAASFTLDRVDAVEFLEVYKGVVPEFAAMVDELTSGAFVAMEVALSGADGGSGENGVVEALREACGPADPEIARVLRPQSVRAKFGFDKVRNAVHCTDLPEDGELETHYFFKILQA